MDNSLEALTELLKNFGRIESGIHQQLQLTVEAKEYKECCLLLKNNAKMCFEQLSDLTVVDMLTFGQSEWVTSEASGHGYSRAIIEQICDSSKMDNRFYLVLHVLSYHKNLRIRLKCLIPPTLVMPSISEIWPSASWYEREAYDLFGIIFKGHPDLRRLLTDYGFVGYPFRKDFPVTGTVELRYDASGQQCVYEQVSIEDRTLVPKVIRDQG